MTPPLSRSAEPVSIADAAVASPPAEAPAPLPPEIAWGHRFEQFSLMHGVTVLCCMLMIAGVVYIGRRQRRLNRLARGVADGPGQLLGMIAVGHWVLYQLWWQFPVRYGNDFRLPLQLCDLAGLVAGLALLTGNRLLTTTLYFWAFALSTQAFVTPVVTVGPAHARFWLFWESHTIIVGSAIYAVAVRGYRPHGRDFIAGVLATLAYTAVVLPINIFYGWNYGYIGRGTPDAPTVIDRLGPWPFRLIPLATLVFGAFVIVYLPWLLADRFGKRTADTAEDVPRRRGVRLPRHRLRLPKRRFRRRAAPPADRPGP